MSSVVDSRNLGNGLQYEQINTDRRAIVEELAKRGISARSTVETDSPYETILADVPEYDVDLVVMGTHGRIGVERYLLGSVTEKIVRTSPVPVLTIRRGPEGESTE